jgi:hypothetical protein
MAATATEHTQMDRIGTIARKLTEEAQQTRGMTSSKNSTENGKMKNEKMILATERATLLLGCYRRSDVNDPNIFITAIAAVLILYDEGMIRSVTDPGRGIQSTEKFASWPPNCGELKAYCEMQMTARAELEQRRQTAAPPSELTDEQYRAALAKQAWDDDYYQKVTKKLIPAWMTELEFCDSRGLRRQAARLREEADSMEERHVNIGRGLFVPDDTPHYGQMCERAKSASHREYSYGMGARGTPFAGKSGIWVPPDWYPATAGAFIGRV